ncbi:1183_t:CDS:2, partial [Racocetra fulgida]
SSPFENNGAFNKKFIAIKDLTENLIEFGGGKYYFPFKCKTWGCKSKEFTPILKYNEETNKKEFADWQIIRLQEVWDGYGEAATLPMTIDCELRDELVETVKPGDFVSVTGKLEVLEIPGDPGTDKRDFLDAASKVAPHTVFTPTNQANSFPLMPLLHHDKRSGDLILEAGSFALSNTGICRIDDFEKITQPNALAEAMSRQTIS